MDASARNVCVVNDGMNNKATSGKFPLTMWEVTVASGVVLGFVLGLVGVYLTMPESDYSFLKLPRSLQDLQILRYFLLLVFFQIPFLVESSVLAFLNHYCQSCWFLIIMCLLDVYLVIKGRIILYLW